MVNFCPNCTRETRYNRLLCDKCQEAFNKGRRVGAKEELEHYIKDLKRFELIADLEAKESNIFSAINSLRISEEKRLKELK